MASAKEHYEHHLAHFYEWMMGDFDALSSQREADYARLGLGSRGGAVAIDLGCGHGPDSIALRNLGYKVHAIDFNQPLLQRLAQRDGSKSIITIESEITRFRDHINEAAVITCMGDTIAHLESWEELHQLFCDCYKTLTGGGKLLLSFRDYSSELQGTSRFIPVRSDENRVLTCFLEYARSTVKITDLLYERVDGVWKQKSSEYHKLRTTPAVVEDMLRECGFALVHRENGQLVYLLAEKP